jgi:hypothetical protein
MGITPFLANFGRTHPLNPQVLFFILRHTFLWDNQDRSRDHPHMMGYGNPWPRPNTHMLYPETRFALCTGRIRTPEVVAPGRAV